MRALELSALVHNGEIIDRDQCEVRAMQRISKNPAACAAKAIDRNPG
jgi:hypothetical protein